jgi:hypothetical protein
MSKGLEETWMEAMRDLRLGTHSCHFYKARQDLLDILVAYFKAGLEKNEFCLWLISEPLSESEARDALRQAVPNLDQYLSRGSIELIPHDRWFVKGRPSDLRRALDRTGEKIHQALADGEASDFRAGNLSLGVHSVSAKPQP